MKSERLSPSISISGRYRRTPGIATRKLGGEWVLVPTHRDAGDMDQVFSLNEVGAHVWNALETGVSVQILVENVITEFDVDQTTAERDVLAFLNALVSAGLIEPCAEGETS